MGLKIFVSYSLEDKEWLDKDDKKHNLIPFLENSLRKEGVTFWYDKHPESGIEPGEKYNDKIISEINKADIVLLLISQEFLNSDFIASVELPKILKKIENNSEAIFPILIKPCIWNKIEIIRSIQMVPGGPTPLIKFTQNEVDWEEVKIDLLKSLSKKIELYSKNELLKGESIGYDQIEVNLDDRPLEYTKADLNRLFEARVWYAIKLNASQRSHSKILKVTLNLKRSKESEGIYTFYGKFTAENSLKSLPSVPFNYSGKFKGETYDCLNYEIKELRFTSFWENIKAVSWVDIRHEFIQRANLKYRFRQS